MKTERQILHRVGQVIWKGEAPTVKDAVQAAVKSRADLRGANLRAADLRGANLRGANLRAADLWGADLTGAHLRAADLTGAHLRGADLTGAYLRGAHLGGANLRGANLRAADLRGANLRGANLRAADLWGAYLRGAHLGGADLTGADHGDAKGINAARITPLLMLLDQPGPIRAYKLVTPKGVGPFNGGITYQIGQSYQVNDANVDPFERCGTGINVATLDWCLTHYSPGYRVLIVEFTAADIAAIPTATDGKFRLHRCAVVGEKDITALTQQ